MKQEASKGARQYAKPELFGQPASPAVTPPGLMGLLAERRRRMSDTDLFVATEAAHITVGDQVIALVPGQTTVRAGHPMLAAHPALFKPFTPSYDWPPADETAPRSQVRADTRAARTR